MTASEMMTAVGLMSGTSMDGIDAALIRTDGGARVERLATIFLAYDDTFRASLHAALGQSAPADEITRDLTERHRVAVARLLTEAGVREAEIDVVGFHGQTIFHDPRNRLTVQLGDGEALARALGIDVVFQFRHADVAAGGEGAPFAPLYHAVLAPAERPVCFLNIGGVANLTWVGPDADPARADVFDHLLAFDTGPGNALIDDWVMRHAGRPFDLDGALAAQGTVHRDVLEGWLDHPYFDARPPKSLDRNDFSPDALDALDLADGAATLTAFTVAAVARATQFLPERPRRWLVTGGGRKNATLMRGLSDALAAEMMPTEAIGLDGDVLEAQAFGYLAVRSLRGLPLSGPTTTGVPAPQTGGRLCAA